MKAIDELSFLDAAIILDRERAKRQERAEETFRRQVGDYRQPSPETCMAYYLAQLNGTPSNGCRDCNGLHPCSRYKAVGMRVLEQTP